MMYKILRFNYNIKLILNTPEIFFFGLMILRKTMQDGSNVRELCQKVKCAQISFWQNIGQSN